MHRQHAFAAFSEVHFECAFQRVGRAFDVPRVDSQRLAHLRQRAGELAKYQHAPAIITAGDVLLGDEVQPVPHRGHECHVCQPVQRAKLLLGYRTVQVVDRYVGRAPIYAIYLTDQPFDFGLQILVATDRLPRRDGDL